MTKTSAAKPQTKRSQLASSVDILSRDNRLGKSNLTRMIGGTKEVPTIKQAKVVTRSQNRL